MADLLFAKEQAEKAEADALFGKEQKEKEKQKADEAAKKNWKLFSIRI